MNKPNYYITKKLIVTKAGKKVLLWIIVCATSGCGASVGTACFGSTGYMVECNRKMEILNDSYTPSDRRQVVKWQEI